MIFDLRWNINTRWKQVGTFFTIILTFFILLDILSRIISFFYSIVSSKNVRLLSWIQYANIKYNMIKYSTLLYTKIWIISMEKLVSLPTKCPWKQTQWQQNAIDWTKTDTSATHTANIIFYGKQDSNLVSKSRQY